MKSEVQTEGEEGRRGVIVCNDTKQQGRAESESVREKVTDDGSATQEKTNGGS